MKYLLFFILFLIIVLSLFIGQANLDISKIFIDNTPEKMIFFDLRIPRTLLAFFSGAILALSGLIFQTIFKNVLTTPYTLGVASGATLFASLAIKLELSFIIWGISAVSLFGFLGSIFSIFILLLFAKSLHNNALLLLGISMSLFYSALQMLVYYTSDLMQSFKIMRFMMGSLDIAGYENLITLGVSATILLFISSFYKKELGILSINDEEAFLRGVNVKKINMILLLGVSFAIGVCVSITGPIGFVGLVIPYITRIIYKKSTPHLIMPTFFYGGGFLLLCDIFARAIPSSSEIPIGVITALIGAPFFIVILYRRFNTYMI